MARSIADPRNRHERLIHIRDLHVYRLGLVLSGDHFEDFRSPVRHDLLVGRHVHGPGSWEPCARA